MRKGINRDEARRAIAETDRDESERLIAATEKLFRTRPSLSYPSAARSLERLGFPMATVYRVLRERAAADFAADTAEM